jgi:hypothetical protein
MAALTGAYDPQDKPGELVSYRVGANAVIHKGALVSVRSDGYAYPSRSGTSSDVFVGVAFESADNTGGAAGAKSVRVWKSGTYVYNGSGFTQASVGQAMYAADDNTLTTTSTNNQLVGYVVEVLSATQARIRIDNAVR